MLIKDEMYIIVVQNDKGDTHECHCIWDGEDFSPMKMIPIHPKVNAKDNIDNRLEVLAIKTIECIENSL